MGRSYWIGPHGQADGRYRLPPHVFMCTHGPHAIFLDLRRDRYFAVETAAAAPLLRALDGWCEGELGAAAADPVEPPEASPPHSLARELLAKGLLTLDPAQGKPATPPHIARPEDDLAGIGLDEIPLARLGELCDFVAAVIAARVALRCLRLERLIERVSRRKVKRTRRAHSAAGAGDVPDRSSTALAWRCAAVHARLRPLFLTARDACLLDSLVLLEFAARRGVEPEWVFGVQTVPFAAHCWVQHGGLVLNDAVERVATFTPILVA